MSLPSSLDPRKQNAADPSLKLRNVLNIAFIVLAAAAIVMRLCWPALQIPFFIIAATAVLIKMGESVVRIMANHKRQQS